MQYNWQKPSFIIYFAQLVAAVPIFFWMSRRSQLLSAWFQSWLQIIDYHLVFFPFLLNFNASWLMLTSTMWPLSAAPPPGFNIYHGLFYTNFRWIAQELTCFGFYFLGLETQKPTSGSEAWRVTKQQVVRLKGSLKDWRSLCSWLTTNNYRYIIAYSLKLWL